MERSRVVQEDNRLSETRLLTPVLLAPNSQDNLQYSRNSHDA